MANVFPFDVVLAHYKTSAMVFFAWRQDSFFVLFVISKQLTTFVAVKIFILW